MTDYTKSIDIQDPLLERPLNETPLSSFKVIFLFHRIFELFNSFFSRFQFQHDSAMF